jgi:pimeloyl-[acyl-carrier protein] methyl ester esterase
MFIETRGSGPPLVLIHGWAMHGGVFAPLLPRLEPHFTLHLVDLPGHGHSRDDATPLSLDAVATALLDALPPAIWMGWSLGGLFALQAALQRPEAVRGLVMQCATPRFVRADAGGGDEWKYGVSAEIFRDFGAGLRSDYRATLDRFVALEAFGSDDARHALRSLRGDLFARGEPAAQVLADGLRLLETADLRGALPSLQVPSLWLAGRRDRLVDPRALRIAAGMAPDARFAQIEQAGHAPFLTHADDVAQAIIDFSAAVRRDSVARHSREGGAFNSRTAGHPVSLTSVSESRKSLDPRVRGDGEPGLDHQ